LFVGRAQEKRRVPHREAPQPSHGRRLPLIAKRNAIVNHFKRATASFASGSLFRRVTRKALPSYAADIDCTSWAQIFLKFLLGHPAITCPLPATAKLAHLEDNMRAARGRLPDEKLRERIASDLS